MENPLNNSNTSNDPRERSVTETDNQLTAQKKLTNLIILKNRFRLITILHLMILSAFVFSFTYYEWFYLSSSKDTRNSIWINLVFIYHGDMGYMNYNQYIASDYFYCKGEKFCQEGINFSRSDCEGCKQVFSDLKNSGMISFILLVISALFQIIDMTRLNFYIWTNNDKTRCRLDSFFCKARFLHTCIILFGLGAISFYSFYLVTKSNKYGVFDNGKMGLCYWICLACIPLYGFMFLVYRTTKTLLKDVEVLDRLIQNYEKIYRLADVEFQQKDLSRNSNQNNSIDQLMLNSSAKKRHDNYNNFQINQLNGDSEILKKQLQQKSNFKRKNNIEKPQ